MSRCFVKFPGEIPESGPQSAQGEDPTSGDQFSTTQLIVQAFSASKEKELTLSEIYSYIMDTYPRHNKCKQTVRTSLASHRWGAKKKGGVPTVFNRPGVAGAVL